LRAAKAQWRALPRPAVTKQDVAARIPCVDPPMPRTWRGLWDALGGGSSNGDAKQARKECEAARRSRRQHLRAQRPIALTTLPAMGLRIQECFAEPMRCRSSRSPGEGENAFAAVI